MARKFIVIDTETAGDVEKDPRVYDIAWSITDTSGATYLERRYLVREVWENKELMERAYYAPKIPTEYLPAIAAGKLTTRTLQAIKLQLCYDLLEHGCSEIYAYNASFDKRALNNTICKLSNGCVHDFLPSSIEWKCIWGYAQDIIGVTRQYVGWCLQHDYISDKGVPITNAEVMYRYIMRDGEFTESHTALKDVRIESQILHYLRKHHGRKAGSWKCWSRWQTMRQLKENIMESVK